MKNKLFKKPDPELEDEKPDAGDEAEVSSSGPSIAAAKKGKMAVIAASSLLITGVVYFLFFKADDKPKDKLEEVKPVVEAIKVTQSDTGKSVFELDKVETKTTEDADILDKPKTPDLPKLPELKSDDTQDLVLSAADLIEKSTDAQQQQAQAVVVAAQQLPTIPLPAGTQPGQPNSPAAPSGAAQAQDSLKISDPKYAPIIVLSGGPGPSLGVGYDKNIINLNADPIQSLDKSKAGVKATFVDNRTNVIAQGKLLTAVLETAINTEIPGSVRAVVSRNVYAEAGNEALITKGSRLFGSYSSQILRGQGRVQINWTRLIRPDGVDLAISSVASDQFGRAGIPGDVDNKYGSTIANSLLTSILAVAGVGVAESLIGGNNSSTTTTNPQQGTTSTTGNASTQAIYNVSKTITDTVSNIVNQNLNTTPAIRVPQGTRITVIVNADMNIPSVQKR